MSVTSLIIGSAQLGMDYGIAKKSKKILSEEFSRIINLARKNGVNQIDTAFNYGNAHKELGNIGVSDFKITTKLPPIDASIKNIKQHILDLVSEGLNDLNVQKVEYLLLHHSFDIVGKNSEKIIDAIDTLKAEGKIKGFGYSVYTPDELDRVYLKYAPDMVQLPLSLVDTRMITSGWLKKLKSDNVVVCARSVFLQGVLLMDQGKRNRFFDRWGQLFERIDEVAVAKAMSKTDLSLLFVKNIGELDGIIVGMESLKQFDEILYSWKKPKDMLDDDLSCSDEDLLNPLKWEITQ